MWSVNQSPAHLQRTASFHSIAASDRSSNASSEESESFLPRGQAMWSSGSRPSSQEQFSPPSARGLFQPNPARWSQKFGHTPTASLAALPSPPESREASRTRIEQQHEDVARSRSSTLAGEEVEYDYPEKTPTIDSMSKRLVDLGAKAEDGKHHFDMEIPDDISVASSVPNPHVPGPLERQLQALMSKLIFMEQENPLVSVTPEEYFALQRRVEELEAEKKTWQARHEALFALRDEDLANIIKIRGLLAKTRRDLEGMTKLRDDDLVNVQVVRGKLAEATRKLEKLETAQSVSGRGTPTSTRGRPSSILLERRDTTDLFAAAKAAALEQRALELEKRNGDLLAQLDAVKASAPHPASMGTSHIDAQNSATAHKAWKETVADLNAKLKVKDDEIARLCAGGVVSTGSGAVAPLAPGSYDWHRVEALHEEHASYRERIGGKMQRLRAEKEELQKELHRKEDECHALEVKVQSLQRRIGVL